MAKKPNIGAVISLDGEKQYREAISNVTKSMSVLKSELKAVSSEFEGNANSLEALRAKNNILSKQQEEQEKRLKLLRGALQDATAQYGENSKKAQDWQIKLNNAYAELNKINKELDDNQRYMREAEKSTDKTAKSIDEFGKEVKNTKEETLKFGDVLKANLASEAIVEGVKTLFNAIKDGGQAMVNIVKETAAYADNMLTLSAQTGIATDTLQELNYMAELTDASLETITSAMARNIRSMNSAKSGTELYVDAYRQLGIQITDTNGQLKDNENVFWSTIDALGNMANETERDAIAMQLFGRSAQELNPLIKVGKDGMAGFADEARKMGAVLSGDTLQKLGETDDALQRMYQQIEVTKREFGTSLAPVMTEAFGKVTDKIKESKEEFTDFAEGSLDDVVNGFIWMVDNADLLISGLKGVTAAIITKKAADGITYAVNAYKTLTVATDAATASQAAFNVASKANVIGAVASLVIGLGTAIYSYAKNTHEASEETRKLNDETQKLIDRSQELSDVVDRNIQSRKESKEAIEIENKAISDLADSLYDLAEKEKNTVSEKEQMVSLVSQLNEAIPNLNLSIDKQTGLLSLQREEVEKLIESQLELNMVQAAQEDLKKIATDKYNEEKALNDLFEVRIRKEEELKKIQEEYSEAAKNASYSEWGWTFGSVKLSNQLADINKELKDNADKVEASKAKIKSLGEDYVEALNYIGEHSTLDKVTSSIDQFSTKYQEAMETQSEIEARTLEDRIETVSDIYDKAGKVLEKKLNAETRAFEKAQEKQVKAVEDAQDKELEKLEKSHQKKLDLINEEYLEKMKNVDEDRYNELKKVQDQIDAIDNQQDAEDRARKLKEEAEKKAELQLRIENATTAEDRLQAQKDLADYEEDLAADRLKTERELQKDILGKQKDTINDAYDAKIKALEDEQKKEEEKADTDFENEKKTIQERYQIKLEAIKEEQALESDNLKDKQEEYKKYLSEQKELAIQNAKDIYEADLKEYKLKNALKNNELTTWNEQGKNTGKGYIDYYSKLNGNYSSSQNLNYQIANAAKDYNPEPIDYDEMKYAFKEAMKEALKSTNLTVVIDGKKFGSIVENRVNNMLR